MAFMTVSGLAQPLVLVTFNDGTANDNSGNGNDGLLLGSAAIVADAERGQVMEIGGSGLQIDGPLNITTSFTLSTWLKFDIPRSGRFIFGGPWQFRTDDQSGSDHVYVEIRYPGGSFKNKADTRTPDNSDGQLDGQWHHYALTLTDDGIFSLYFDGVEAPYRDAKEGWTAGNDFGGALSPLFFGTQNDAGTLALQGYMDNIQVYNYAVPAEEISGLFLEGGSTQQAGSPVPADGGSDVLNNVELTWKTGEFAQSHTVYMSKNFNDVNDAIVSALVSEGADVNSLALENLDFGETYFWRVDEVNGTPDYTVFPGNVWSFEVEPYSLLISGSNIAATASSDTSVLSTPDMTVNGSGLDANDIHATNPETMWFSTSPDLDPWIQYEFDDVKKLDIMKVWNSNGASEIAIGWGVKDVRIEYSLDGENWDLLADASQFSRAPGLPGYDQYDEIDFGGVAAKYVRLDIESNWGGILMAYSLSEVQFYMIPTQARSPMPASGSVDVSPRTTLKWRAGRDAAEHTLYVSADENAVADGSAGPVTSNTTSYDLGTLDLQLDETYYWRVDEVNEAEASPVWAGPVWNLSTPEFLTVDDFEGYGNLSPDRPFQTWLDGFGYSADDFFPVKYDGNGSGSGVGHDIWGLSSPYYDGSIMEDTITMAGSSQSLPLYYSNGGVTDRKWAVPQNWAVGGVQTLVLYFYGAPENTGQLYVQVNNGTQVMYDGSADAMSTPYWTQWNIDLVSLGANLQAVTQLSIGVQGGSGLVIIDDIRLYKEAPAVAGEQLWIEAETAAITAPFQVYSDKADASGGSYIGTEDLANSGDQSDGIASFTFTVQGGTYKINALVIAADAADSFWVRLQSATLNTTPPAENNGWIRYNGIPTGDAWHWDDIHNDQDGSIPVEFTLPAGTHTLEIGYREDGALLDAIMITDQL